MRSRRLRSVAKWGCTGAAVLVAAAIILSRWYALTVAWRLPESLLEGAWSGARDMEIQLTGGRVFVVRYWANRGLNWPEPRHVFLSRYDRHYWWGFFYRADGPEWFAYALGVWPTVVVAGVPAGLLWRTDIRAARRRRVGTCSSCGYDRSGLPVGAKCPECGKVPA